jgi:hypothetical protein
MYAEEMTIQEIVEAIGPGVKIQNIVEQFIPLRRPGGPRDQSGEKNPQWKGDAASYSALHLRVQRVRGKPKCCACCDAKDSDTRYEWANLTGHYEDINDYIRLCVLCHRRLDARRRKILGRLTRPERGGDFYV